VNATTPRHWRLWLALGGLNGLVAVAAGAYGAHGFEDKEQVLKDAFNTGAQYQMGHALALLAVAWLAARPAPARWRAWIAHAAGVAFLAGIVLFVGTLYAFGLTGAIPVRGMAPAGGMLLMAGWAALTVAAFTSD
jgi:uncharacterized membrane protein YgdD (TMEM256/DUF423 family)